MNQQHQPSPALLQSPRSAPRALDWLELSLAPDRQLVVNKRRTVRLGEYFPV